MKREKVIEHMATLVDTSMDVDATVRLVNAKNGHRIEFPGDLALALVASTLLYCIELLEPGAVLDDPATALEAIVRDGVGGYLGV